MNWNAIRANRGTILMVAMAIGLILMGGYMVGTELGNQRVGNELGEAIKEARLDGIEEGAVNIFKAAYKYGFVTLTDDNLTAKIYSPQGCINAVKKAGGIE